jgi:hypothetical protein
MSEPPRWLPGALLLVRLVLILASGVAGFLALAVPLRHGDFYEFYPRQGPLTPTWPWTMVARSGFVVCAWLATQLWRDVTAQHPGNPR